MRKRDLLFVAGVMYFLSIQTAYNQKVLYPEIKPVNARFDNFLIMNGKAAQAATSVFQDKKGFMWFGTENGLYRFDGNRYVEYGINRNESGFAGHQVNTICEDSDGFLWIGTSGALNRLDQKSGKFRHFYPDTSNFSVGDNIIRFITEDRRGDLWLITDKNIFRFDRKTNMPHRLGTDSLSWRKVEKTFNVRDESDRFLEDTKGRIWIGTDNGLYNYYPDSEKLVKIYPEKESPDNIINSIVNCIKEDEKGNIWCGTQNDGLIGITGSGKGDFMKILHQDRNNPAPFEKNVTAIFPDPKGILWIFGNNILSGYNDFSGEVKSYIFSDRYFPDRKWNDRITIEKIFRDSDGTLWLLYKRYGQLFRFEPASESLSLYFVPTYTVIQCIKDNTGSLWFGCVRNNIFRLEKDYLSYMTAFVPNSCDVNSMHKMKMLEDDQDKLWLLLSDGAYYLADPDVNHTMDPGILNFPRKEFKAISIFQDTKGNLWYGGNKGDIFRYDPVKNDFYEFRLPIIKLPDDYLSPQITIIHEDIEGNIWFATIGCGIFKLPSGSSKIELFIDGELLPGDMSVRYLTDFLLDGDDLLIATNTGLYRIDRDKKLINDYSKLEGKQRNYGDITLRIRRDNKNDIWILNTFSGIYQFDRSNNVFSKVFFNEEIAGTVYYDLLIDRFDRFWIARNNEILFYDPVTGTSRSRIFPRLQYDIQSYRLKSGLIVFLNEYSLLIFREKTPVNRVVPLVAFTRFLINGTDYHILFPDAENIDEVRRIDLPYNLNTLSIEFAALNYLHPEQNKYRYFMTKRDKDSVTVSQGLSAEYQRMPPGRYKFWVTGSNNDGLWNKEGVSLEIRIHPPWYRSVLAYTIYVVAFISLIAGYIRFRTYRLTRDKIRLKARIEAATEELEIKNRQLAEIDRIKTHFFTDISHEIRTPLSLILGPLENISKEEMLSRRMSGMIDMMKRNAQRLMHLVNQLLDISRLDAGKMKITLIEDDIVKYLRILVYEFLSMAESKQINYIADLPEKSFKTWFDRDKTEKIISNLLTNAFKFAPQKGEVQCVVKIENDKKEDTTPLLKIRVLDSGPGIRKEHQDRIFDRFYRIEGHHEADGHGTGIGLSLVQEFVSLLHGKIDVDSTPGKGSDFSIILPLGKDHLSAEEYVITQFSEGIPDKKVTDNVRQQHNSGSVMKAEKEKLRILIIEDNEDLRKFIKESLYDDYNILEAENGINGRNTAFTMIPDLIVTDIMMTDLDGIKLCSQLKNDERTSHIPIIMLTAKATIDDRIEGLKSGADDYIVKPFNMAELETRISNLLALRDKLKIRYAKFYVPESGKDMQGSVDDRFMARVLIIINANLRSFTFDVGSLHEQLGMSRMHLTRKLKILTGLSPGLIIRNIRLEKAAELILTKKGNITEIANSVGISNPSNFTKSFRNYFGVSPKDYVKH